MEADPVIYLTNAATTWRKPQPVIEAVHASLLSVFSCFRRSDPVSEIVLLGERGRCAFFSLYLRGKDNHDTKCSGSEYLSETGGVIRDPEHPYLPRLLSRIEQNNIIQSINSRKGSLFPGQIKDAVRTGLRISVIRWRDLPGMDLYSPGRKKIPKKDSISPCAMQVSGMFLTRIPERIWDAWVSVGQKHLFSLIGAGGFLFRSLPGIRSLKPGETVTNSGCQYLVIHFARMVYSRNTPGTHRKYQVHPGGLPIPGNLMHR